ncbi:MAG: terpene cyclase/mutase family protein [Planctomycetes bacterium]|nr:terpene cyclase/mutase family protein [Planctomycetota bacterium]
MSFLRLTARGSASTIVFCSVAMLSNAAAAAPPPLLQLANAAQDAAQDAAPAAPAAASLAERVNRAIDGGVARLKAIQRPDGHFPCDHWSQDGTTALCTYALLKSGVLPSDPAVVKAMEALRYAPFLSTYATAVRIALFDAHGDAALVEPIRAAAAWLEERQQESGFWGYPEKQADLSNTQYAALGLWVAARHGYTAKRDTWAKLLKELLRLQADDGGFGYREGDLTTGSMTTAGLAVGHLAVAALEGDSRYGSTRQKGEAALERAWQWLIDRFTVEGNPDGERSLSAGNHLYYLFGLERVAAIGERKRIGDHDWYAEGARHLVRAQRDDGGWFNADGTSFALLFLRRATFTGMKAKEEAPAPLGGPLEGEPQRPGPLAPFLRRWLVCGPLADPKDALLEEAYAGEATVEPKVGSSFRGKSWREVRELDDFVGFGPDDAPGDRTVSYAFTWLHVNAPFSGGLWVGADDGVVVQLDGKVVLSKHVHQPIARDRASAPVTLAPGIHRLLVKVENEAGRSGFTLRFAQHDGTPARDVRPSLSKGDPQLAATALAMPGLFKLEELAELLPPLPRRALEFKTAKELELLAFDRNGVSADDLYPQWSDAPEKRPGAPSGGARGLLALHPPTEKVATRLLFRVALPDGAPKLALRLSPEAVGNAAADFVLRVGAFDATLEWLHESTVGPLATPAPPTRGDAKSGSWRDLAVDLSAYAGRTPLVVIEVAAGGAANWNFEHAFFDEIAIR